MRRSTDKTSLLLVMVYDCNREKAAIVTHRSIRCSILYADAWSRPRYADPVLNVPVWGIMLRSAIV